MKVQIDRVVPLPSAPGVAWALLQDLESVAGCMPGAKITERLDANRYKGTVTVKLGPATMVFRGEVEMSEVEIAARSMRLTGKGTDSTGGSGATLNLTARVDPGADAQQCSLVGNAEVSMSGKAVAFGGRMMNAVADQVLKQFADNFAARVGEIQAQSAAPASGQASGAAQPQEPARSATGAQAPQPVARELDGLALIWSIVKDWLRSLFAKKTV